MNYFIDCSSPETIITKRKISYFIIQRQMFIQHHKDLRISLNERNRI